MRVCHWSSWPSPLNCLRKLSANLLSSSLDITLDWAPYRAGTQPLVSCSFTRLARRFLDRPNFLATTLDGVPVDDYDDDAGDERDADDDDAGDDEDDDGGVPVAICPRASFTVSSLCLLFSLHSDGDSVFTFLFFGFISFSSSSSSFRNVG